MLGKVAIAKRKEVEWSIVSPRADHLCSDLNFIDLQIIELGRRNIWIRDFVPPFQFEIAPNTLVFQESNFLK